MRKTYLIMAVLLVFALVLSGCGSKVVATVNGEKISEEQLNTRMEHYAASYGLDLESEQGKQLSEYLKEQTIQMLIEEKLILQAAKERGITAGEDEIEAEFKNIKASNFKDESDYERFLKNSKLTEKDLKEIYVQNKLVYERLFSEITKDITATTKDTKAYYDENKEEFYQQEQIRARNIVVKTEEEAQKVIERLNQGEDFAQLAVELSIDESAKVNKGEIPFFDKDAPYVQEFKDAAFQLKVGEYTKTPVKSEFGYHVIKNEEKQEARQFTYEEVKKDLEERFLMEEKNEKFSLFFEEYYNKAEIENKLFPEQEGAAEPEQSDSGAEPPAEEESDVNGESRQ